MKHSVSSFVDTPIEGEITVLLMNSDGIIEVFGILNQIPVF